MSKNDSSSKKSELDKEYHFIQVEHMFLSRNETRLFIRKCGYEGLGIYFALAARSAPTGGVLVRKEFDDFQTFEEELAFLLELPAEKIETVKKVLRVAANQGLIKLEAIDGQADGNAFSFPSFQTKGMEQVAFQHLAESTPRVRKSRKNKKETAAAAEGEESEDHIRRNEELLQCNAKPLHCSDISESETKQHSQIHIESEKNNNNISFLNSVYVSDNGLFDKQTIAANLERFGDGNAGTGRAAETAPVPAAALTLDELRALSEQYTVGLNEAGLDAYSKATQGGTSYLGKAIDVPARAMRAWAKRNREKHPEWFSSTSDDADQVDGNTRPAWMDYFKAIGKDGELIIKRNPYEAKEILEGITKKARQGYTNKDFQNLVDCAYLDVYSNEFYNDLLNDGYTEAEAKREIRNDAKELVTMRQVVDLVKKSPDSFSTEEIAAVWETVQSITDMHELKEEAEDFKEFLLNHRRKG